MKNGIYEYVNETVSGDSYHFSCTWALNAPELPSGYNWTLNSRGHIAGDVVLSAEIAGDGVEPDAKVISFNTEPTQPKNLSVAWYNGHPKLTWDSNLEEDISSYKIWKSAGGSTMIAATVTHNSNSDTQNWIDYSVNLPGRFDPSIRYDYKVKAVDNTNKESEYSEMVSIWGKGSLWKSSENDENITTYDLKPNYPNPFNPSTKIEFQLPKKSHVNLTVYNSIGKTVKVLVDNDLGKGKYKAEFNASDLPSGVYFYTLRVGDFTATKKMILMK